MSDKAILHKYVAQNEHTTSNGKNGIESKTEQIYQAILGMIRDGSFRSGDKLPNERAMADQFHCSRAIVRDALLRVQSEGLVVRKVGSGTYVSAKAPQLIETRDAQVELISDTPYSFSQIIEARLIFEPEVAAMAASHATREDLERMASLLEEIPKADCWLVFKEKIYSVTRAIYQASHNSFMVGIFDQIITCRRSVNYDGRATLSKVSNLVCEQVHQELQVIVNAITNGEVEEARSLIITTIH